MTIALYARKTASGVPITDKLVTGLADKARAGYCVTAWTPHD